MSQPKLNSFFGFEDLIKNMASDRAEEVGVVDDAMALTAIDLSQSSTLSANVQLRNTLQTEVGELTTQSKGYSVAQLRAQRKKKGK